MSLDLNAFDDPPADLAQQGIAGVLSEDVVDLLEPVEIDAHDREHRLGVRYARQHRGELVVECGAVRQIGERVVTLEVRDLVARALLVGHVLAETEHVLRLPVLGADQDLL
jgi:hypothetical protein